MLNSSIASVTDDQSEDDLQDLEPPPERDFTWDEFSDDDNEVSRIADDINGLAVSLDSLNSYNASYLGFSSVPTILRVNTCLPVSTRLFPQVPRRGRHLRQRTEVQNAMHPARLVSCL